MSFGIADLMIQEAINVGLENLRQNPHHIEYILGRFCQIKAIRDKVGDHYVKNIIDLVLNQSLTVRPYYSTNTDVYPQVVIAASQSESQTYMGDYGSLEGINYVIDPHVYSKFDLLGFADGYLTISPDVKFDEVAWIGMALTNGVETVKLQGVATVGSEVRLFYSGTLPSGFSMKGWEARSFAATKVAKISASTDKALVQAKLSTNGDMEIHRAMALIIRYCLKKGRPYLNSIGFQNATFSQTPPTLSGSENEKDSIFETVFTIEGEVHDSWIESEFETVTRIDANIQAVSDSPGRSKVKL